MRLNDLLLPEGATLVGNIYIDGVPHRLADDGETLEATEETEKQLAERLRLIEELESAQPQRSA